LTKTKSVNPELDWFPSQCQGEDKQEKFLGSKQQGDKGICWRLAACLLFSVVEGGWNCPSLNF